MNGFFLSELARGRAADRRAEAAAARLARLARQAWQACCGAPSRLGVLLRALGLVRPACAGSPRRAGGVGCLCAAC